ncbi:glycosyltransferase family 4 protein [Enterovibrio paralichthyis]|uniref:glycosyltransferase family 4 protein n=1 Tax=Enterovibrio paralichthyis TaxID=2853805 RepID=UPI001C489089|nr:glycosyltransferase family 4 protein [Enterovibrio paralichthyis]MBV7298641.1 glycosyltransferase family 4 protein [Enterovibrio paralichthyis]
MKMLVISAYPSSLVNFRGDMLQGLSKNGVSVAALSSGATEKEVENILEIADEYHDYKVSRNGINPIEDFFVILRFIRFYLTLKPDSILAYTVKPVVFGGIAARLIGFKNFNALITGLGFAFQKGSWKKNLLVAIVTFLYRVSLKNAKTVTFQNKDNLNYFVENNIVDKEKCHLVSGSGVNLDRFIPNDIPASSSKFLLIARLLIDKGIREYIEAAELTQKKYPDAEFHLVGPEDPSPNGISEREVMQWHDKGTVIYHGATSDVRPFIADTGVFVLPSYHEGLPRTVLEAMAMAKPILTTDVPGCRDTVENGVNGWLVEKGNAAELYEKMCWFIENEEQSQAMGKISYDMAKNKFDVHKVNEALFKILKVSDEKGV